MSQGRSGLTRRSAFALAVAGAVGLPRLKASGGGNRTIVHIHLFGGNDANSLLVPLEDSQYSAWARARGELAMPAGSLLPVRALRSQTPYGFHPAAGELRQLFRTGVLAVVANVGAPARPSGHTYESLRFFPGGYPIPAWAAAQARTSATGDAVMGFDGGVALLDMNGASGGNGSVRRQALARAGSAGGLRTQFPATGIGRSLEQVAAMIRLGRDSGAGGQVFLVPMGGFDTHSNQASRLGVLFGRLSSAMNAFYEATLEMGVAGDVATVTDSEFGRSLYPNATHGTDHGWANHHLVMGASVQGGDIYGDFPDFAARTQDSAGRLTPTTFRDQFYGTLQDWLNRGSSPSSMGFLV